MTDRAYVSGVGGYFFDQLFAVGSIPAGQSVVQQVRFVVPQATGVVPRCTPACSSVLRRIINEAHLFSLNPSISTGIANSVIDPVLEVGLALVDPAGATVLGGSTASYEIQVRNTSSVIARQVRVSALAQAGGVILLERQLEMGDIAPGQTRTQRVAVLIPRGLGGSILVHTAEVNYLQTAESRVERSIVDRSRTCL